MPSERETVERRQVWLCDFDQHPDSRQNGVRPCVVVQTDHLNRVPNYTLTIVLPLSTKGADRIPSHARIMKSATNGLSEESFVKCEQIQTVPQSHLIRRLGVLSEPEMASVEVALRRTLAL